MWLSPNLPLLPTVCQSAPILVSQPQSSPNLGQSAPISCPLGLWSSTLPLCAAWVRSPCALPWPCLGALSLRAACARCMGAACARCMGAACALHGRCLRAAWALPARCLGAVPVRSLHTVRACCLPLCARPSQVACMMCARPACCACGRVGLQPMRAVSVTGQQPWRAAGVRGSLGAQPVCAAAWARCLCARQPGRAACVRGSLGAQPVCAAAWARCLCARQPGRAACVRGSLGALPVSVASSLGALLVCVACSLGALPECNASTVHTACLPLAPHGRRANPWDMLSLVMFGRGVTARQLGWALG